MRNQGYFFPACNPPGKHTRLCRDAVHDPVVALRLYSGGARALVALEFGGAGGGRDLLGGGEKQLCNKILEAIY